MRHYLGYVSDNPLNLLFTCLKITHGKQWKLTNISILDDPRGNAGSCIYLQRVLGNIGQTCAEKSSCPHEVKLLMEAEPASMKIIAVHRISLPFGAEKPKYYHSTAPIENISKQQMITMSIPIRCQLLFAFNIKVNLLL